MSGISTHVLDTSRGAAAVGVAVTLERAETGTRWTRLGGASTDSDGRIKSLIPSGTALVTGNYRLRFETGAYFAGLYGSAAIVFFPVVEIVFNVADPSRNHHVPLLLSPFGYSTYRGT